MNLKQLFFLSLAVVSHLAQAQSEIVVVNSEKVDAGRSTRIEHFRITHESDPEQYVLVTVARQENNTLYGFKICKTGEPEKCQKIGRDDFYDESALTALRDYFLLVGRFVFWSEVALGTSVATLAIVSARRNPAEFLRGRSEAAVLEAVPRAASMAMRAPSSDEELAPSLLAPLARLAGQVYEQYGKAVLFGFLLNVKSELMGFISTMTSLLTTSLSPAEHFRAVRFLDHFSHPNSDMHFRKREYASFSEYFSRFHFANLAEITQKLEDVLEAL